jgi:hypothetical protein
MQRLALQYRRAGLNVLPFHLESKNPLIPYREYWDEAPPPLKWQRRILPLFRSDRRLGALCGKSSGGLEVVDIEDWGDFKSFVTKNLDVLGSLPLVRTQRGGHIYFRSAFCQPKQLVAYREDGTLLTEIRGERCVVVLPGGPPAPGKRPYEVVAGNIFEIPSIGEEQRKAILAGCRALHRGDPLPEPKRVDHKSKYQLRQELIERLGITIQKPYRPGDDYNKNGPDWLDILTPHGWELIEDRGEVRTWKRPHKEDKGHSATTGYAKGADGTDLFHVFSSDAAPFEPDKSYNRFQAYALLNWNGDWYQASEELRKMGYGYQRSSRAQPTC